MNKRDWVDDAKLENGNYRCKCRECEQYFNGHKRRQECYLCNSEFEAIVTEAKDFLSKENDAWVRLTGQGQAVTEPQFPMARFAKHYSAQLAFELADMREMLAEARHTVYAMLKRDLERLKDEADFRDDLINRICFLGETLTTGKSKKDSK